MVHLEFMSENQNFFELRMAGYYVEIYQAYGRHPRQRWCTWAAESAHGRPFQEPNHELPFRVVDLSTLNGEQFLASEAVGDQILSVLMRLRNPKKSCSPDFGDITTTGCASPRGSAQPIDGTLWITRYRDRS